LGELIFENGDHFGIGIASDQAAVESAILIIQTLKLRLFWERSAIALHTLKI
jgi:hypothetical protein